MSLLVALGCGDDATETSGGTDSSTGEPATASSGPTPVTTATPTGTSGSSSSTASDEAGETTGTDGRGTTSNTDGTDTTSSTDDTDGGSTTTGGAAPLEFVVLGAGQTVHMYDVTSGALVEVGSAEIPTEGLNPETHQIFNIVQQASQNALYVASSNDCVSGPLCFGNGRLDRFTFDETGVAHDSVAYNMNNAAFEADGIECAAFDGGKIQQGSCAPRGLAFSADGTRLYVSENDIEHLQIFSVDAGDGSLGFLAEGATTRLDGLAVGTGGQYLYNGMRVYSVAGDIVAGVSGGMGGNGTVVLPGTPDRVITALGNDSISVLDLTDPEDPAQIDSIDFDSVSEQTALGLGVVDETRIVTAGRNVVQSIAFDGETLSVLDTDVQTGFSERVNQAVALAGEDDEYAVVAYFRGGDGLPILAGGAALYEVDDATGALNELGTTDAAGPGRTMLTISVE